jgi:hypothetical protein
MVRPFAATAARVHSKAKRKRFILGAVKLCERRKSGTAALSKRPNHQRTDVFRTLCFQRLSRLVLHGLRDMRLRSAAYAVDGWPDAVRGQLYPAVAAALNAN